MHARKTEVFCTVLIVHLQRNKYLKIRPSSTLAKLWLQNFHAKFQICSRSRKYVLLNRFSRCLKVPLKPTSSTISDYSALKRGACSFSWNGAPFKTVNSISVCDASLAASANLHPVREIFSGRAPLDKLLPSRAACTHLCFPASSICVAGLR